MAYLAPSPSPIASPPLSSDCDYIDIAHILLVAVLVIMAIVAMFLLHTLGSLRRLSSHGLLHAIVMGISTLSYPLVSFTIGRLKSQDYCYVDDFAVWAVFMILLLGSTDSLTVCRLGDIDNWKSIYVTHLLQACLVVYVVVDVTSQENGNIPHLWWPLFAILLVGVLKWYVRIASMRMVSRSYLSKNMRVIDKYMEGEHKKDKDNDLPGSFDPVTMEGYKYVVAGEKYCITKSHAGCTPCSTEDGLKVITVEKIWRCTGNLLRLERGMLLKDVCLSMALSKMLNRRFAGFKVSEAGLEKTHDFVFKGLLAGNKPYQRPFRVIEEELVFVHDIYYTRYSYFYHKGRYLALILPAIMLGLFVWLAYKIITKDHIHNLFDMTIFITVVLATLEAYQLYLYVASGWFKVALIRSYVSSPLLQRSGCFPEMILGFLLRLKAFRSWKNTLGQYSILGELGHKGRIRSFVHYATLRLVDNEGKKGSMKSVKLSENVKKAVVDSLLRSNGHLTDGITSLTKNGVHAQLSWACDATGADGSVSNTILVWHIATTLCKHHLDAPANKEKDQEDAEREDMVTTATTLSQYCMHLLAFAPDLLPDSRSVSESILDESIQDAREILKGCKRKEHWCEEIMRNCTPNGDGDGDAHAAAVRPLLKGARLARHLIEEQEVAHRWRILSEFWAEMMLYVSPSDNARAHLEALARGGEFITQLWALLTHAGVLKRLPTGP